jgi:UTP--glucose-1-phosphate uridylyltransferase
VYAFEFEGTRYDVGEKMGFIRTTVEFALQREDLRENLLDYLTQLLQEHLHPQAR